MNETEYKSAAWLIAEKTPEHLGQPTIPPILWRVEGDVLVVLLADGRKARAIVPVPAREAPIQPVGAGRGPAQSLPVKKHSVTVTVLPVHPSSKKKAGRIK